MTSVEQQSFVVSKQCLRSMKTAIKIVFCLIWYWRSNVAKFWFSKLFFYVKNQPNLYNFFLLKNTKMGDKLSSIPYLINLFSKNLPKFWRLIPNQAKLLEYIYGHFYRPTNKLSYAQLFKWGHSNMNELKLTGNVFSFVLFKSKKPINATYNPNLALLKYS